MNNSLSRRRFLSHGISGLSSAWITAHWPAVLSAADHAHRAAQSATPPKFEFFSPEQAAEIDAIAARIIPTDGTPGAREAGVVYFIDDHAPVPARPFRPRPAAQSFFETLRQHTITGFLVDPDAGGNRDGVGWKVIGREREHMFQPPFGYYDKDDPGWQPVAKEADKK